MPPDVNDITSTSTSTSTSAMLTQTKTQYDVIVVGAGVAGSAMAVALGNDGRKVLLIERDWNKPDRIVGELLQPGGVKALLKLGLEDCLDDIDAVPCHGYQIIQNDRSVLLSYRSDKLPKKGASFHHGGFIMNLRRAAKATKNVKTAEGSVSEFIYDIVTDQVVGVKYSVKRDDGSSETVSAMSKLTIVADGCFSKFRKHIISKDVVVKSHFVGFVLNDCVLPSPNHGHVVLAEPSPILLYQIGTHDTRILVDIPGKLPSQGNGDLKRYMADIIGPQLPSSIQPSFFNALKTERLRVMPNSYLPPSVNKKEGVILLGDAMNMRHPLTGGGMTVCLWDVVHLRELLSPKNVPDLSDTRLVVRQMSRLYSKRKGLSSVVNILAQALYDLFSAGDDPNLKVLQIGCFGYLGLGGRCAATPVGLLSGLLPEPMTLLYHFFAVAFYGIWLLFRTQPLYKIPENIGRSVLVLYTACVVFLPVMARELF